MLFYEFIKFVIYSGLIVLISKYILVKTLRKLAENLNLKAKTIGNIAGYATSVPELLTIATSSFRGLMGASVYNILSSNIINFIQYMAAIILNKNRRAFENKAIKIDIIMVLITIAIPIILLFSNLELNLKILPIFILLYALFVYINSNAHKLYLENEDKKIAEEIEEEGKSERGNTRKTLLYVAILLGCGILLFVVGDLLGNTLENMANVFNIPQIIIGVLLGFITSIPELITFFEAQKHYKNINIGNGKNLQYTNVIKDEKELKDTEFLGVVEATNNLLTSNILNLFIIQIIGILIYEVTVK